MIHMVMRNQAEIYIGRNERQAFIVFTILPFLKQTTVHNELYPGIVRLFHDNQIARSSYLRMYSHDVCVEPFFWPHKIIPQSIKKLFNFKMLFQTFYSFILQHFCSIVNDYAYSPHFLSLFLQKKTSSIKINQIFICYLLCFDLF